MSTNVKRLYSSPLREQAARRTRAQIRSAAGRLFVEHGYVTTTMRDIADAAGVAPRTVFSAFPGGKFDLFHECLDVATAGDERPVPMAERAEVLDALDDPDRIVTSIVEIGADLLDRAGPLIMTMVESSGADDDMRGFAAQAAAVNYTNVTNAATALRQHGLLRTGLTVDYAADVLQTLCSPHVHALFRQGRGWTTTQYRDWLSATIASTLLRPAAHSDGTRNPPRRRPRGDAST